MEALRSAGCAPVNPVVFVNAAATPGGFGGSWQVIAADLQDALDIAHAFPNVVQQIWHHRGMLSRDADVLQLLQRVRDLARFGTVAPMNLESVRPARDG